MAEPISECPICYETISTTNSAVTPCNHRFHTTCLLQAAALKSSCPYCRAELNPPAQAAPEPQVVWDDDDVQQFLPPDDPIDGDLNEFLVQHFNRHFQPPAAPAPEPIQVRDVIIPPQYLHYAHPISRRSSPDRSRSRPQPAQAEYFHDWLSRAIQNRPHIQRQPRAPTISRCGICREQGHNRRSCPFGAHQAARVATIIIAQQ